MIPNQGYEEDEEEDVIVERVANAVHVLAELVLSEREAYVKVTDPVGCYHHFPKHFTLIRKKTHSKYIVSITGLRITSIFLQMVNVTWR